MGLIGIDQKSYWQNKTRSISNDNSCSFLLLKSPPKPNDLWAVIMRTKFEIPHTQHVIYKPKTNNIGTHANT